MTTLPLFFALAESVSGSKNNSKCIGKLISQLAYSAVWAMAKHYDSSRSWNPFSAGSGHLVDIRSFVRQNDDPVFPFELLLEGDNVHLMHRSSSFYEDRLRWRA